MKYMSLASPPKAYLTVIVTALLCGWLFARIPRPVEPEAVVEDTAVETQAPVATSFSLLLDAYPGQQNDDVRGRPLMMKGRRPFSTPALQPVAALPTEPEVAPEPEPPTIPSLPSIAMLGFVEIDGKPRALLRWNGDTDEEWYAPDAVRDGWSIVAIESQSVRVSNGTDEITVKMFGE